MTNLQDLQLDHLVIAAYRLETGVEYIERILGVRMETGGVHASMGTHNAVLKLAERQYLEVIAPHPGIPKPKRKRWFGLDLLAPNSIPRLVAWVARTPNIKSSMLSSKELNSRIEFMHRGNYEWLISVPPDGSLPYHGILPAFIEWQGQSHPAEKLTDSGCKLIRLEAYHQEPERILAMLKLAGVHEVISVFQLATDDQPYLSAHIETAGGVRELSGKAI